MWRTMVILAAVCGMLLPFSVKAMTEGEFLCSWQPRTKDAVQGQDGETGLEVHLSLSRSGNTITGVIQWDRLVDVYLEGEMVKDDQTLTAWHQYWTKPAKLVISGRKFGQAALFDVEGEGQSLTVDLQCKPSSASKTPAGPRAFAECQDAFTDLVSFLRTRYQAAGEVFVTYEDARKNQALSPHLKAWLNAACTGWTWQGAPGEGRPKYIISTSPKGLPACVISLDSVQGKLGAEGCPAYPEDLEALY